MNPENHPDPDDGIRRALRRLDAQITRKLDQNLADVRTEYLALRDEERRYMREWINKLASLEEPEGVPTYLRAKVQLLIPSGEDAREVLVSVRSLKRALQAWDQGEDYLPKSLGDI
jgi:hypothetical protein